MGFLISNTENIKDAWLLLPPWGLIGCSSSLINSSKISIVPDISSLRLRCVSEPDESLLWSIHKSDDWWLNWDLPQIWAICLQPPTFVCNMKTGLKILPKPYVNALKNGYICCHNFAPDQLAQSFPKLLCTSTTSKDNSQLKRVRKCFAVLSLNLLQQQSDRQLSKSAFRECLMITKFRVCLWPNITTVPLQTVLKLRWGCRVGFGGKSMLCKSTNLVLQAMPPTF